MPYEDQGSLGTLTLSHGHPITVKTVPSALGSTAVVRAGLGGVACAHLSAVPPSPWHLGQRPPAKFDVKAMRWEAINAVGLGTRPVPSNAPERVETQQRQSRPQN